MSLLDQITAQDPVTVAVTALAGLPVLLTIAFFINRGGWRWQTLKNVRGPPQAKSWWLGHQREFYDQTDVGQLDFAMQDQFGGAWKIDGCFGRNILMLSDPVGIHHTIHTMGYHYPKTTESKTFTGLAFGRGVSWAGGETHMRHRKLMGPAFTATSLRTYFPVFRRVSALLTQNWKDKLQAADTPGQGNLDISRGLVNSTLDIIGEAVFDYHFGSLDGTLDGKETKNEFADIFHNLFAESNLNPPSAAIMFAASWAYWPNFLLRLVEHLPFRQFIRFREFLVHGKGLGKNLLENSTEVSGKKGRDILSILSRANKQSAAEDQLDEDEILSQVTTLLFAGHETTATTLTWMIYELAHHPEDQARCREEVQAKRAKIAAAGQKDFNSTDFDNMPFMNAVIKEALRYHPISPWITRESDCPDSIPLAEPILGADGKMMSTIEIPAHQPVLVSTCAYNRNPVAWGSDAHLWNPSRHLDPKLKEKQTPVGLYSNVLTFAGGPSGCLGWRFALTEMQSSLVEMVENFEFAPPVTKEPIKMLRTPVGAIMAPMIEGKFHEKTQMPLMVTSIH